MLRRRGLLRGLLAAPFVVRTPGLLMPVRPVRLLVWPVESLAWPGLGLPTTDAGLHPGMLWNDGGVVRIA